MLKRKQREFKLQALAIAWGIAIAFNPKAIQELSPDSSDDIEELKRELEP